VILEIRKNDCLRNLHLPLKSIILGEANTSWKDLCIGKSIWRNKKDQHHHHHLQILSPSGDETIAFVSVACVYYSPTIIPSIDMEKQNILSNPFVLDISSHFSF
jgi:hypothetical protein